MGLLMITEPALAKDPVYREAVIIEPFLEIHTGPAGGYPVFYVAEKGETIFLIKRRIDWYRVRLRNGQEGWTHRREIERTLLASGYRKRFTERIYDDFIAGKAEMGWAAGTFGGDQILSIHLKYTLTDVLAADATAGFASGDLGGTQLYHGGLVVTPWKSRWFSISGTLGGGFVHVTPTSLLVNVTSGTFPAARAGVGFTIPFFKNLAVCGDVRTFTLFMNPKRTQEFQEYSLGLSFLF
jgi:hypothetical protein